MTVNYHIIMGTAEGKTGEHFIICLPYILIDILVFNSYRTVRPNPKTNKKLLCDFKNYQYFKFGVVLK